MPPKTTNKKKTIGAQKVATGGGGSIDPVVEDLGLGLKRHRNGAVVKFDEAAEAEEFDTNSKPFCPSLEHHENVLQQCALESLEMATAGAGRNGGGVCSSSAKKHEDTSNKKKEKKQKKYHLLTALGIEDEVPAAVFLAGSNLHVGHQASWLLPPSLEGDEDEDAIQKEDALAESHHCLKASSALYALERHVAVPNNEKEEPPHGTLGVEEVNVIGTLRRDWANCFPYQRRLQPGRQDEDEENCWPGTVPEAPKGHSHSSSSRHLQHQAVGDTSSTKDTRSPFFDIHNQSAAAGHMGMEREQADTGTVTAHGGGGGGGLSLPLPMLAYLLTQAGAMTQDDHSDAQEQLQHLKAGEERWMLRDCDFDSSDRQHKPVCTPTRCGHGSEDDEAQPTTVVKKQQQREQVHSTHPRFLVVK